MKKLHGLILLLSLENNRRNKTKTLNGTHTNRVMPKIV